MGQFKVVVPAGVTAGQMFAVDVQGRLMQVRCPAGSGAGQEVVITVPSAAEDAYPSASPAYPSAPPAYPTAPPPPGQAGADLYRSALRQQTEQQQQIISQQQQQLQQQQQIINQQQQQAARAAPPPPPQTVYIQSSPAVVSQPVLVGGYGGYGVGGYGYGGAYNMGYDPTLAFAGGVMMGAALDPW